MKKLMTALSLCLSVTALAAPPTPPTPPNQERQERHERMEMQMSPAQREEMEKHERMQRVLGLAEELDLNTNEALRVDEVLRKYDERRRPLRQQVSDAAQTLERAADGDAQALGQVDQAAQRIFEARTQLAALDKEMFQQLSKDLRPQQRAKMAVFFARYNNANVEKRMILRKHLLGGDDENGSGMRTRMRMKLRGLPGGGGGMERDIDIDD